MGKIDKCIALSALLFFFAEHISGCHYEQCWHIRSAFPKKPHHRPAVCPLFLNRRE